MLTTAYAANISDAAVVGNQVIFSFDMNVYPNVESSKLVGEGGAFYISDSSGNRIHEFNSDDKVEVNGKTITVSMNEDYEVKEGSYIAVAPNSLKTKDMVITNSRNIWMITVKPGIRSVTASTDKMDSKGGEVTVAINGYNLDKVNNIECSLRIGMALVDDAPIEIVKGKTITATFKLPDNKTDNAITYHFTIDSIDGIINNSTVQTPYITVLAPRQDVSGTTVSMLTLDGQTELSYVPKPSDPGDKHTLNVMGTNLDPKKVEVRAIDENGVVWPVYHYSACSGTIRFHSTYNGNGATGGGSIVTVEVMFAKTLGVEHTYTIQVSVSGKGDFDTIHVPDNLYDNAPADTFLSSPVVTVHAAAASREECTADEVDNVKTVKVKYVDQNGKELAKTDEYRAYGVSMLNQFPIKAKEIADYELVDSPKAATLKDGFVRDIKDANYTLTYKYKSTKAEPTDPTDPKTPTNPTNPTNPTTPSNPTVPVTPVAPQTEIDSVSLSTTTYTYNKMGHTPVIILKDKNGNVIDSDDYTVTYPKDTSRIGKHEVTVEFNNSVYYKGKLTKTLTLTYKVMPRKVSALSIKAGKKAFTAKWKKDSSVSGYTLQYSKSKKFAKSKTVTKTFTSNKSVKKTIKKLKTKNKYYVRVRSYKKVSGSKYYSKWSAVKSVKVK